MESSPTIKDDLKGKTVLLTRPSDQSRKLTELLQIAGARVIHFPTIEIAPPADWSQLDSAIERIGSFDWIIFTSVNAVMSLNQRAFEKETVISGRNGRPSICVIGAATARAVESVGLQVTTVASQSDSAGLIDALLARTNGELKGLKLLLPRGNLATNQIPDELRRSGAEVTCVEAYRTIRPDSDAREIVRLVEDGKIWAVTFFSPSAIKNLAEMTGPKPLSDLLRDTLVCCIGSTTAAAALEHEFTRIVTCSSASDQAMVETLMKRR